MRALALGKQPGDVAHFAARARLGLAVEVDGGAGLGGEGAPFVDIGADQIGHHRIAVARRLAERPAANRPNMVLELADETGIERPMAGIMDARGEFVDDQRLALALALEHLHAKHADMAERVGDLAGNLFGRDRRAVGDAGGRAADGEDAVLMHVLHRVVEGERAVLTAHDDHRDFAFEQHQAFEQRRHVADRLERGGRRILGADRRLALAVIAEAARLEQRRRLDARQGRAQILQPVDAGIRGDGDAEPADEILLGQAILRDGERLGLGENRRRARRRFKRLGRHVLELAGHHVDVLGAQGWFKRDSDYWITFWDGNIAGILFNVKVNHK